MLKKPHADKIDEADRSNDDGIEILRNRTYDNVMVCLPGYLHFLHMITNYKQLHSFKKRSIFIRSPAERSFYINFIHDYSMSHYLTCRNS